MLQSFIHIFGMAGMHFSKFVANSKKYYLAPNQSWYYCNIQRVLNRLVCRYEKQIMKFFLWRKYEPNQSISMGEINFDRWTFTHSCDELHMCIMSNGNDVNFLCKLIQLDQIHCRRIKQLNKISCCFKMKYVSSMKMHSKFILSRKFYINSINENAHNLFRGFLLMNGGTFIHFSFDGIWW